MVAVVPLHIVVRIERSIPFLVSARVMAPGRRSVAQQKLENLFIEVSLLQHKSLVRSHPWLARLQREIQVKLHPIIDP